MSHSSAHDDAPNATSKHAHGDREVASRAVTINRPVQEVYAFFRDLTKAPLYMEGVSDVTMSGNHAHWVSRDGDKTNEWDSEIINDVPDSEITWQTIEPSKSASGRATFNEVGGRGTIVTLTTAYEQAGGIVGKMIGKVRQTDPAMRERRDLRRLKQLLETGEIATSSRTHKALAEEKK